MMNNQLQEFAAKQKKLAEMIKETSVTAGKLGMESCAQSLENLVEKISSDSFKIMFVGGFSNGKSTFINALLGQDILPAFITPTTTVVNEVKYGQNKKAVLHFREPLPERYENGLQSDMLAYIRQYKKDIPPVTIAAEDVAKYATVPVGESQKESCKQSPFLKLELFWPLEVLEDNVEMVDSPGLEADPAHTQTTLEYLSKADAVILVFSAIQFFNMEEETFLDNVLVENGFEDKSLFCVINRFDQVDEMNQSVLREYVPTKLAPYTKNIFFTSAYKGLRGKMDNDPVMLEDSGIPEVEQHLQDYLVNDRGKVKLASPAKELTNIIRKDILDQTIPQQKSALSTDLNVLKKRYSEAEPEITKLKQKKEVIVSRLDVNISNAIPDIRRSAINYFNNLPGNIRGWVSEYEPETKVSMNPLKMKKGAEALATELSDYIQRKIDADIREWLAGPMSGMIGDKIEELKGTLEGRLKEFFVSVDQIKVDITGKGEVNVEDIPVWKRVVAAGGGLLIGDIGVAAQGLVNGLSKEFAKGVALQIGAYFVLALVGLLNPITIIAVIVASVLHGNFRNQTMIVSKAKEQTVESYCEEISKNSMQFAEKVVDGAKDNFNDIRKLIANSMDAEIKDMKHQMETIIRDMEQGQETITKKENELAECEKKLKGIAEELDSFIFELIK